MWKLLLFHTMKTRMFVIREFDVKQILRGYNAYYSIQLLIPDIQLFIQIFFEENILYFQ